MVFVFSGPKVVCNIGLGRYATSSPAPAQAFSRQEERQAHDSLPV
jgi:hypothetical protein